MVFVNEEWNDTGFIFYNGQNLLISWHGADGEINRSIWRQSLLLKIWILRITSFC